MLFIYHASTDSEVRDLSLYSGGNVLLDIFVIPILARTLRSIGLNEVLSVCIFTISSCSCSCVQSGYLSL